VLRACGACVWHSRYHGCTQRAGTSKHDQQLVQVSGRVVVSLACAAGHTAPTLPCSPQVASSIRFHFPSQLFTRGAPWVLSMFVSCPNNLHTFAIGDTALDQLLNFAYELALRREQLLQSRYSHFIKCVPAFGLLRMSSKHAQRQADACSVRCRPDIVLSAPLPPLHRFSALFSPDHS
jgi:hypothetical protein